MSSFQVYSETYQRVYSLGWADQGVNQPLSSFQATSPFRQGEVVDSLLLKAPGSSPISGRYILCNPNPSHHPNSFLPLVLAVLLPTRDIMSPRSGAWVFSPHLQDSVFTVFPTSHFNPHSRFFLLNLNLYLASLFAIFPNFFLVVSWLDWLFLISSNLTGITDKGKPFERMGRKTTDLSNGRWVIELRSRISPAHSFEVKIGLFFYEKSRGPSGGQS